MREVGGRRGRKGEGEGGRVEGGGGEGSLCEGNMEVMIRKQHQEMALPHS